MKNPRPLLPWLAPAALLALVSLTLGGTSRAYAEEEKPKPVEPGMGEPAAEPSGADADEDDDAIPMALSDRVKKAVDKGVNWLKQRQLPDGSWGKIEGSGPYAGQSPGGTPYLHPAGST